MNTRALLNIGLILLAALLVAVVWLQPGLHEEPVAPLLTRVDPKQVKELRLANGSGELVLQREGQMWRLQSPTALAANTFRVEQLLHWLVVSSVQSYDSGGLDLAKFGLDHPQAVLNADGVELRFGNLDPLNHRRYLLFDGRVHLVAESELTAPLSPWSYFVSPQVVPQGVRIKELAIPGLGEIIREESGWRYSGKMVPASADLLQQMVDEWGSAQALSVEPLSGTTAHEQVVITFEGEHPPLRLMVRRGDDLVLILEGGGIEYHMGEQGRRLLNWPELDKAGGN